MVKKEENNIVPIASEQDDFYSDDDLYNITSWGADLSFREIITMYDEGELVKPELQRKYVWDKTEASRFIDSLLLGLPVPSIFFAKKNDEKKLIVDGYQRIMTVYDYVRGIFSTDNKVFKLSNSKKINERWRGKAFKELNDNDQRKIKSTTIHAIIFEQKKPKNDDTSMFQIFERINTSGRTLFSQEIRNCIYQGSLNTLLISLNKNNTWRELYGLKEEDSRMRDMEYILRFFALSSEDIKYKSSIQISLKKYLNDFMGDHQYAKDDEIESFKNKFINTIEFIYEKFKGSAFHNISKDNNLFINRFHPTIFDAISIATLFARSRNNNIITNNIQENRIRLLKDSNFKTFISERTTNIENINGRISLALKYLFDMKYE